MSRTIIGSGMLRLAQSAMLGALGLLAASAQAENLAGAWSLQEYEVAGEKMPRVSGLLVMDEDRFGLVYTMGPEDADRSGRAHFGRYRIVDDEITFDVQWWPERVNGKSRVAPRISEPATIALDGDALEMLFGSGSVQRWKRIASTGPAGLGGAWQLRSARTESGRQPADGILVVSDGRFSFVSSTAGDVSASGGSIEPAAGGYRLTAGWAVGVAGDRGRVSEEQSQMTLSVSESGDAELIGSSGTVFQLQR